MPERLYTTFQVADLLGAAPSAVNEWVRKGWLACEPSSNGPARISERGLMEFLKRRGIDIERVMAQAVLREGRGDEPSPVAPEGEGASARAGVEPPAVQGEGEGDPASQIADAILRDGVTRSASAIHLEPEAGGLTLRLRIDGVMHDKVNFRLRLPKTAAPALMARFKSLAGLDLAESRRPQCGAFTRVVEGRELGFQVATHPVVHGERLVVLVLDPARVLPGLSDVGLPAAAEDRIRRILAEPCGIILVAAPGRMERAITLRAMLQALNSRQRNIVSVEVSAGVAIEGVSQSRIDPASRYDFAEAVEALSGQDADAVLVEEIRDSRTAAGVADLAAEGRLVLAGMPARTAAAAVAALAELSGQSYMLAATLLAVIEQRTVRRLCQECKAQAVPDGQLLERSGLRDAGFPMWAAGGCTRCANTGYAGTAVLSAVIEVGPSLAWSIRPGGDARAFERAAMLAGVKGLRDAVVEGLKAGTTSLEEVARVLPGAQLGSALGALFLSDRPQ